MTPQQKAAKGLELINESIVDYLKQENGGVRKSTIGRELGLLGPEEGKFTRVFICSQVPWLEREGRIRSEVRGNARLFFPL